MKNSPKVSVIIPCYNHGRYIKEAVNSVLSQTFQDFEIVITDDCSTDKKTPMQIKKLARADERIKTVLLSKNIGPAGCRNAAIKHAKGQYILPLDADDKIAPQCLEKALATMKEHDADVVYWKVKHFGAVDELRNIPKDSGKLLPFKNNIVSCSLYKKSDWKKYGGYNENMNEGYEDWDFWLCFFKDKKKFIFLDEILFYYRTGERGTNYNAGKNYHKIKHQLRRNHPEIYTLKNYYLTWKYAKLVMRFLRKKIIRLKFTKKQKIISVFGFNLLYKDNVFKD